MSEAADCGSRALSAALEKDESLQIIIDIKGEDIKEDEANKRFSVFVQRRRVGCIHRCNQQMLTARAINQCSQRR